jgi:ribosomal protein S6--L-glutamate ligase
VGLKLGLLCHDPTTHSNQRIVEEARKRGHEMEVIEYLNCDLRVSHAGGDVYYQGKSLAYLDAIIPRIAIATKFYGLAVLRQFEAMGIYSVNGSLGISRSKDKLRCLQILARRGLPIPKTAISNSTQSTEKLVKALNGTPLVIKLIEGMQGIGTILADTDQVAISVIEAFSTLNTNMILQEFIREANGRDIRVLVIGKKMFATMERIAKPGEFRSNLHRGGSSQPIALTEDEIRISERAAAEVSLNFAGVDVIRSKDGPLILEVNSSPGLTGIERTSELNVAGALIEYIEENHRAKDPASSL